MPVCLVAMSNTHEPREPGSDTLCVLCFRSPCCAGQRSVSASGLGMWLQEGCRGQTSGVVAGPLWWKLGIVLGFAVSPRMQRPLRSGF